MHARVSTWKGATTGLVCVVGAVAMVLTGIQVASAGHHTAFAKAAAQRSATLNGANEVPGPGDANGRGHVTITLRPGAHRVCAFASWSRIGTPNAAHIHKGVRGVAGPVKVDFTTAVTGGAHCKRAPVTLLRKIKLHPSHFYFNIHNARFPAGAIRGQLHR